MTPLYLGWQYATPSADPGPPPAPPPPWVSPLSPLEPSPGWLAAQRREERRLARPQKAAAAGALAAALVLTGSAQAGWVPGVAAWPAVALCLAAAGQRGWAAWRRERLLRGRVEAERRRVRLLRSGLEGKLRQAHAEHQRQESWWREQHDAFARQKRWYAVPVPGGIDRVDVAGGTLAGWSAVLTMAAAYGMAGGGEATVVDLTGGAVAADLARLCAQSGEPPAVWVLPRDLPRLDLAATLSAGELAGVLALAASAGEERGSARDLAIDTAIVDRVIGVLGDGGPHAAGASGVPGTSAIPGRPAVARVLAGLRALARVGDPRADLAAGLVSEREVGALGLLFGQGAADRVVLERALGLEAQLRPLSTVGTGAVPPPRGRLRVIAVERGASAQAAAMVSGFTVTALTHLIGRVAAGPGPASWRHPLFLLGAERLRGDVLDRLADACEAGRVGLVLGYRSMPPHVRERIGRGNAAVAFMRLGNAEDAKAASEQIGSDHRFVVAQLTETVGTSVTDTLGGSYTSTAGDSASAAGSVSDSSSGSAGTGRTSPAGGGVLPLRGGGSRSAQDGTSWGTTESVSLTAGISTSTAWGVSTSRAAGDSESLARSLQRSRELLVEPSELQRLPATAMIVSYADGERREVLLADANPAIGSLPVATLTPLAASPGLPTGEPFPARSAGGARQAP